MPLKVWRKEQWQATWTVIQEQVWVRALLGTLRVVNRMYEAQLASKEDRALISPLSALLMQVWSKALLSGSREPSKTWNSMSSTHCTMGKFNYRSSIRSSLGHGIAVQALEGLQQRSRPGSRRRANSRAREVSWVGLIEWGTSNIWQNARRITSSPGMKTVSSRLTSWALR